MCVSPAAGMHAGPLQMFLEVNNSFIKKKAIAAGLFKSASRESPIFSNNRPPEWHITTLLPLVTAGHTMKKVEPHLSKSSATFTGSTDDKWN